MGGGGNIELYNMHWLMVIPRFVHSFWRLISVEMLDFKRLERGEKKVTNDRMWQSQGVDHPTVKYMVILREAQRHGSCHVSFNIK